MLCAKYLLLANIFITYSSMRWPSYNPRAIIINIHHHFRETVWYNQTTVGTATGQTQMEILVPSLISPHPEQGCRNSEVTGVKV